MGRLLECSSTSILSTTTFTNFIYWILFLATTGISGCQIPFEGQWLRGGIQMTVTQSLWDNQGYCIARRHNQFLLVNNGSHSPCHRCLVAFPVHENIVQYKITNCIARDSIAIDDCGEFFRGDASLHTMFRANASGERCPLSGPLNFTFSTPQGSCLSRTSTVHQCAVDTRMRFEYEACPELPHREAINSDFECIGEWRSLGSHFFAARRLGQKEEEHRCFIIEKNGGSGRIGVSADSTCQELTHISAANTVLNYKQDTVVHTTCSFSKFLQHKHGYRSMSGQLHFFDKGEWSSHKGEVKSAVRLCLHHVHPRPHVHLFRVHVTKGCQQGYQCVMVEKQGHAVVHVHFGTISNNEFEDCEEMVGVETHTLFISNNKESCPPRGDYYLPDCDQPFVHLPCDNSGEMILRRVCAPEPVEPYQCVTKWKRHGVHYVIMHKKGSSRLMCMRSDDSRIRIYDTFFCNDAVNETLPTVDSQVIHAGCPSSILAALLPSSASGLINAFHILLIIYFALLSNFRLL